MARPGHWIKNGAVLLPVVFGRQAGSASAWLSAVVAAAAFCLASSCAYIVNDIADRETDQAHPRKKHRPIAAGRVSLRAACIEAAVLGVVALIVAWYISAALVGLVAVFLLLEIGYSLLLKHKVLVDVISIALAFVLRAAAGAVTIAVVISPWLFVCMFTACLFMGFCKRYGEVVTLGQTAEAGRHRKVLFAYTPEVLTHLVTVSAGIAVVSFLLYGMSPRTVGEFGTYYFVYTLPVVIYGVFRFAMLSMKGIYADPTDLILHDRPFQLAVVVWLAASVGIVYYGKALSAWLSGLG